MIEASYPLYQARAGRILVKKATAPPAKSAFPLVIAEAYGVIIVLEAAKDDLR